MKRVEKIADNCTALKFWQLNWIRIMVWNLANATRPFQVGVNILRVDRKLSPKLRYMYTSAYFKGLLLETVNNQAYSGVFLSKSLIPHMH